MSLAQLRFSGEEQAIIRFSFIDSKELLNQISKVEIDDLEDVGKRYLLPVFDAATSRSAVVCHPTKVESLQKEFQVSFS